MSHSFFATPPCHDCIPCDPILCARPRIPYSSTRFYAVDRVACTPGWRTCQRWHNASTRPSRHDQHFLCVALSSPELSPASLHLSRFDRDVVRSHDTCVPCRHSWTESALFFHALFSRRLPTLRRWGVVTPALQNAIHVRLLRIRKCDDVVHSYDVARSTFWSVRETAASRR